MRKTPLYSVHREAGAKITNFNGWAMPLQFEGILKEHHHTRAEAALFDCSHMGQFLLRGSKAIRAFDPLVFNDMICLPRGRCKYSSILDICGGIIDDIIVMRLSAEEWYVVTNAGPLDRVSRILHRVCDAENLSAETAKIDIQGPKAYEVLAQLALPGVEKLKYFNACRSQWKDYDIVVARSGYTGELGYELFVPNEAAEPLWRELSAHECVKPAGLGARDTLRLEMGYTLYGQDVDESHTTLEAGMGRFIDWDSEFQAKEYLVMQREMGRYKVRTGIRSFDRRAPRHGHEVSYEGQPVGIVTSGTFGPSVGHGIGMAYIPVEIATPGTKLTIGPKDMEVETAEFPFYKDGTCRMKIS